MKDNIIMANKVLKLGVEESKSNLQIPKENIIAELFSCVPCTTGSQTNMDNKWYIYFAAGSTSNVWAIRIYVLENTSTNPLTGTWVEKGEVTPSVNAFSLDAHYFEHNKTRYLVFAKADASVDNESCLFIASLSNPWTYSSTPVRISKPDYSWERAGIPVNEGPAKVKFLME